MYHWMLFFGLRRCDIRISDDEARDLEHLQALKELESFEWRTLSDGSETQVKERCRYRLEKLAKEIVAAETLLEPDPSCVDRAQSKFNLFYWAFRNTRLCRREKKDLFPTNAS